MSRILRAVARLRDLDRGVEAEYSDDSPGRLGWTRDEDHEYSVEWQWTEGNYGCDCNRSLFLSRMIPGYEKREACTAENRVVLVSAGTDPLPVDL